MAETDENKVFDGAESSEENKTPDEKLTAPVVVEFTDTGGDGAPGEQPGQNEAEQPQQPQTDAPEQEQNPDAPAGEEKLRQEQEALLLSLDSKADEMNKKNPASKKKDAPAQGKTGKPPQADKSDKAGRTPQTDKGKPEKPKQGEKPQKSPKDKKAASVGGGGDGGDSSGQQPGKEETPQERTAAMAAAAIESHADTRHGSFTRRYRSSLRGYWLRITKARYLSSTNILKR